VPSASPAASGGPSRTTVAQAGGGSHRRQSGHHQVWEGEVWGSEPAAATGRWHCLPQLENRGRIRTVSCPHRALAAMTAQRSPGPGGRHRGRRKWGGDRWRDPLPDPGRAGRCRRHHPGLAGAPSGRGARNRRGERKRSGGARTTNTAGLSKAWVRGPQHAPFACAVHTVRVGASARLPFQQVHGHQQDRRWPGSERASS